MSLNSKQIAKRVRNFRLSLPRPNSQQAFGDLVGYKGHQIKDIENGNTRVPAELIANIEDIFGVSADHFLSKKGTSQAPIPESKNGPVKQFPYMDGSDVQGWTPEDYMWDRANRHVDKAITKEERIVEFLAQRPEEKEKTFEKAIDLETIIVRDILLEKLGNASRDEIIFLLKETPHKKTAQIEDILSQLNLNDLYLIIQRYRTLIECGLPNN